MNIIKNYTEAVKVRVKSHDDIIREMEEPFIANFAQSEYHFPNGIMCGVGKSRRPGHASMYQIIVIDFDGKPNIKFPVEYAGEYTTPTRAEKGLLMFCKSAWEAAEGAKTKQVRKTEAAKELSKKEQMDEMLNHEEMIVIDVKAEPELVDIPKVADQSTRLLPTDSQEERATKGIKFIQDALDADRIEDAPATSN